MGDDPFFQGDAPTRSVGPTLGDVTGVDPNAPPLLGSGDTFGPYVVVRLLGRGGMGEVYEVEDRENARRVALKVLSNRLSGSADRARFMREGRLAAGISHPNTVYVYGTDDINGVPVIAMELAPGGTLKDRVKIKGPLPPSQAVDAILQVIAGLEAAADAGVLHRDIKPSNCFVDSNGTVKVGDFGLSISTQTFDERSLTMLGTVLGTPGFSSPEQLRGDELDVRADIYSVGATLYYLLTGKAPFDDPNVIKLVTQVAQEIPQSPRVARPDVPPDLANVVMRALAKKPAERFESYAALRETLEPFSSNAPAPAPLGLRLGAGVLDNVIMSLLSIPVASIWWQGFRPDNQAGMIKATLAGWGMQLLYYGLSEGVWGRSIGKHLFGLRVVDLLNHRLGIPRGLFRAAAWILSDGLPLLVYSAVMMPILTEYQNTPLGAVLGLTMPLVTFVVLAIVFSTARRRNGYAAIHDLVTGTRVVLKRREHRRRSVAASAAMPVSTRERIGPYVVLDEHPLGMKDLVGAYDDKLRRRVWVQVRQPRDSPLPPERRALARPARLRWLGGRRTETESWDAFEAPEGVTFTKAIETPRSWAEVRYWLLDLATEIRASETERVPLVLSPERIWITPQGRARVMDWGASLAPPMAPQAFLRDVAVRGTSGPLPPHAHAFLNRLERGGFETTSVLVQETAALTEEPAELTRGRRVSHLLVALLPMLLMSAITLGTAVLLIWTQSAPTPNTDLERSVTRIDRLRQGRVAEPKPDEQRAFEIYVAARYAALIRDERTWTEGWSMLRFNRTLRRVANETLAKHPNPSSEDVGAAATVVEPFLANERQKGQRMVSPRGILSLFAVFGAGATIVLAVPSLLSALLFRGGLVLRLLGIAVVTATGEATRLRAFWRALIAWSPAARAAAALALRANDNAGDFWLVLAASAVLLFLTGFVYAVRNPSRGLQDKLAGTWLVPR